MRLPIWAHASALAALLAAGWAAYSHIRAEDYREGFAVAEAACTAEQQKQELANRDAIDVANKRLIELAGELTLKELQVDDYVKAIDLAAAADPSAAEQCLGIDSVRRINAIR